jgi:hypothetical protein
VLTQSDTTQAEAQRHKTAVRSGELAAVRGSGPALLRLLREAAARAGYLFADHTRNALILSVFAFKVCGTRLCVL